MSRIEPIRPSRALVTTSRRPGAEERRERREAVILVEPRERRRGRPTRISLGPATDEAAFAIHRMANGGLRGLKADLTARRVWGEAYAEAAQTPAPRPCHRTSA